MIVGQWYAPADLAGLPGLPSTDRRVRGRAQKEGWERRPRETGKGYEYSAASLPAEARRALAAKAADAVPQIPKGHRAEALRKFQQLPKAKQDAARSRYELLRIWWGWLATSGQAKRIGSQLFCADVVAGRIELSESANLALPRRRGHVSLSYSTLNGWEQKEKESGLFGLADSYGNRKGRSKIENNPELKGLLEGLLIQRPHITAKKIREWVEASRPELLVCSERGIQRYMDAWRGKNHQTYRAMVDPDGWRSRYMAAQGSYSDDVDRLNQRWELDATPADWMFTDGRHSLSGLIDVYSRGAHAIVTKTPRAEAHCLLLRRAIIADGMPDQIKIDNGQDYASERLARVCRDLEIEQKFCPPFSPEKKPHIERFFQTLSHGILDLLPGFVGHNVAERKIIEARKAFSARLMTPGETIEVELTAEQFVERLDRWIDSYYMGEPHGGLDGRSPRQIVAEYAGTIRRINNHRALDLLLQDGGTRTVGKKGIRWDRGTYIAPELVEWIGDEVECLLDPTDHGRLHVYGDLPDGRRDYICCAEDPDRTGIDRAEVAIVAKKRQKSAVAAAKAAHRETLRQLKDIDIVDDVLRHRAEQAENVTILPRKSIKHTTQALTAAEKAARIESAESTTSKLSVDVSAAKAKLRMATVTALPGTAKARYAAWRKLDNALRKGEGIDDAEHTWWKTYRDTSEWRAQRAMAEDFGGFGMEGET